MKISEHMVYSITIPVQICREYQGKIGDFSKNKKHHRVWIKKKIKSSRKKIQYKYSVTYIFYSKKTAIRFWGMLNL